MSEWTFLTNHALALSFITKQPHITARELSSLVGITERAIRKIIAELDETGYIEKKREGRRTRYRIHPELPLRHNTLQAIAVGDFLGSLGWEKDRSKRRTPKAGKR